MNGIQVVSKVIVDIAVLPTPISIRIKGLEAEAFEAAFEND